jgi:succinate dehydrogenase flavin-adding protein (antitoxin of CptAB toxin-antitoxin module)
MGNWTTWGSTSEAQLRAQARYDSEHTKSVSLKLNNRTDQDILQWLRKQKSKQGAIKQAIRNEIARRAEEQTLPP